MSILADMLARHEGVRLTAYKDSVGKTTIGVGRNLDDLGITKDEAMLLLSNDIARVQAELRRTFPWFDLMLYPRQDALTDMAFNLGLTRLLKFEHCLAALAAHDYETAATEMLASNWAKEVGARATELSTIIRIGNYVEA